MSPRNRVTFQGYYGDKIEHTLTVTSLVEDPLNITDISSTIDDKIKYELKTLEEGKKYSLEISTVSGIEKSFRGKIALKTNSQKKPEVEIFITGKINREVKISPKYIYYGIIYTDSKEPVDSARFQRSVMVKNAKGDGDVTIEKIESSKSWITTAINTDNKSKKQSVIIKIDKDKLPKEKFREKVTIHARGKDSKSKKSEPHTVIIEGKVI